MPTSTNLKGTASFFSGLLQGIGEARYRKHLRNLQEEMRLKEQKERQMERLGEEATKYQMDTSLSPYERRQWGKVAEDIRLKGKMPENWPKNIIGTYTPPENMYRQSQGALNIEKMQTEKARQRYLDARARAANRPPAPKGQPKDWYNAQLRAKDLQARGVMAKMRNLRSPVTGQIIRGKETEYQTLQDQYDDLMYDIEEYSIEMEIVNPHTIPSTGPENIPGVSPQSR